MSSNRFFFLLIFPLLLIGLSGRSYAQGWTFTETVSQSGQCIPFPSLPPITYYTKDACESARQSEIQSGASDWSVYGDGNCTTVVTCSPCTGSDIGGSSGSSIPGNPGSVNFNGIITGNPLFSAHDSKNVEEWINSVIQYLVSKGYPVDLAALIAGLQIPTTGNDEFDKYYASQVMNFSPPVYLNKDHGLIDPNDLKNPGTTTNKTVQMPGNDQQWYHLEPLPKDGVPPLPASVNDPNSRYEHPKIELARQVGVTLSGWLPDGAAYPGILAVNIWAVNAESIQDIRDGNNPLGTMASLKKAYENSLTDIRNQAADDLSGAIIGKGANLLSADEGMAKLATKSGEYFSKFNDIEGDLAYGQGDGIFTKVAKIGGWFGFSASDPAK